MIRKLTKEQEALIPVFRDKWVKIGLSTIPFTRWDFDSHSSGSNPEEALDRSSIGRACPL